MKGVTVTVSGFNATTGEGDRGEASAQVAPAYKVLTYDSPAELDAGLNAEARAGWRVVSIAPDFETSVLFIRE